MRLLRLAVRLLGLVVTALFGYAIAQGFFFVGATTPIQQSVLYGLVGVSVLLAVFWKGMGELAGGLALVIAALWALSLTGYASGALTGVEPFALVGVVFFVCGLSELFQAPQPAFA